ncbi:unnamed protein product [Malus baccata var. baccata]
MDMNYDGWIYHREHIQQVQEESLVSTNNEPTSNSNVNMFNMIEDVFEGIDDDDHDHDHDHDTMGNQDTMWGGDMTNAWTDVDTYEMLLGEAQKELYLGCKQCTVLTYVVELIHTKVDNHMTNKAIDKMLAMMKKMCPQPNNVPNSFRECKKILNCLGLGCENVHACYYDCALFYKEHEKKDRCPVCNEPRYKDSHYEQRKKVPRKVLRYFPLKPRLQRLFILRHTSKDMRWHKEKRINDGNTIRHPADSSASKEFDHIDGVTPYSDISKPYSMWPVVVFPYNLPPWKCMKKPFSFLTLLIPGPKAPGNEIDVYLRPLVDELKELWENGVPTHDKMIESTFNLRAAVMWTINDFPAYGNLSGWSTHGKLACPVCNEDGSYTKLRDKYCHIGHLRYLPMNHSWRKNSQLFNGCQEMRHRPKEFLGDDILDQLDSLLPRTLGKHRTNKDKKRKRNAKELNWTRKSIFFRVGILKNIFDYLIGALLNMGKSKDTLKARMHLQDMNIRESLHLKLNARNTLDNPLAQYVFKPYERKDFLHWLKSIKFPDGYVANISHKVNVDEGSIFGLKSHDCHVLMQRHIYGPIVEFSSFFQQICAKTLTVTDLDKLEEGIVLILCKLEKNFPSAFFVPMVHLTMHLPREAKLAGLVGYLWMYPVERLLGLYKKSVRNKARPEGSIVEAHLAYESSTFCSINPNALISVFAQKVRPFGAHVMVQLSREDIEVAYWYILDNCDEIEDFRNEHIEILERDSHAIVQQRHRQLGKKVIRDYHLTSLNVNNRSYDGDPYVLAKQAHQVFYIDDLKLGHPWKVVQKIQHRHIWDVPEKDDYKEEEDNATDEDDDEYVDETENSTRRVHNDDEVDISLCRDDVDPESFDINNEEVRRMLGLQRDENEEEENDEEDKEEEDDEEENVGTNDTNDDYN